MQLEQFSDNSIDELYLCHVLEHISFNEVNAFLKLVYLKLKIGGIIRISVPSFESILKIYINTDTTGKKHCIAWIVLNAARDLYNATHYLGGTAVTAPPFFDTAARSGTLFWHPDPTRRSELPVDSPLVMALADFTDKDFEENYAPHLQRRQDWVILTPPCPTVPREKLSLSNMATR